MLNKLYLFLKCVEYKPNCWYVANHKSHTVEIEQSDHVYADYKVNVYDGSQHVSTYYTTNLWSI